MKLVQCCSVLKLFSEQSEAINVTLKCSGVTHYNLCHESRAITFKSNNSSKSDRAITLGCDIGSNELEVITFIGVVSPPY